MGSLSQIFTANRVAALCTWLAGLAALILGVLHTLPGNWQNGALIGAGLLTKLTVALKYLDGAQKWDALTQGTAATKSTESRDSAGYPIVVRPESALTPDGDPAGS